MRALRRALDAPADVVRRPRLQERRGRGVVRAAAASAAVPRPRSPARRRDDVRADQMRLPLGLDAVLARHLLRGDRGDPHRRALGRAGGLPPRLPERGVVIIRQLRARVDRARPSLGEGPLGRHPACRRAVGSGGRVAWLSQQFRVVP
eukprot:22376-Pelagococcus_subviridis.AAC.1